MDCFFYKSCNLNKNHGSGKRGVRECGLLGVPARGDELEHLAILPVAVLAAGRHVDQLRGVLCVGGRHRLVQDVLERARRGRYRRVARLAREADQHQQKQLAIRLVGLSKGRTPRFPHTDEDGPAASGGGCRA